ncbi:MAG: class D sortase [Thermoleophilia bacterium]|jgi:sortase A
MSTKAYTRYKSGRWGYGRSLSAPRGDSSKRRKDRGKPATGAGLVKKITTVVMIAGLGLVLYAGWVFGFGYYQARAGQDDLRAGFSLSDNRSVDSGHLKGEANAMNAGLAYLGPVGEIYLPKIDVKWMIVQGSDKEALKKGPGHIQETTLPGAGGNFAVAGDRVLYGAPFLNLNEIAVGDQVKVKMPYGTFIYRVNDTFIVTPDDVSVLQPVGCDAITLLTCDPPWDIKQRIVVRGILESVQPAGTAI